jgi:acyl-CoA synthetase (AMP-forming)/AMP-acid ligase II
VSSILTEIEPCRVTESRLSPGRYPPIVIPPSTISEFVFARRHPDTDDRPAFIDGTTGRHVTHADVLDGARRVASGLMRRGFRPGEVLAIMAPNVPHYPIAFHGVVMAGGTATLVDPTFTAREAIEQLADAGATWLVTTGGAAPTALEAATRMGIQHTFVIGGCEDAVPFDDLLAEDPTQPVPIDPSTTVAALPYSYGIGGSPKGAMLTHRSLTANLAQLETMHPIEPDEATVAVLPFFHTFGLGMMLNSVIRRSSVAITMARFSFERFLAHVEQVRATRVYVVPSIVLGLAAHPAVDHHDLSSVRQVVSGGAPLDPGIAAQAADRLGCEVTQGYGLTEASPVTHSTPLGCDRPGSSGVALPNTEVRIVDRARGGDVPHGQAGELWVRGPQVMAGYKDNPSATRMVLDDAGWLRTGDLARLDEDDRLFVVGRLKEVFKSKGSQVSPAELEARLLEHPEVVDALVTPAADMLAGEIPIAQVVTRHSHPDLDAIKASANASIARHKRIRAMEAVESVQRPVGRAILLEHRRPR